jgi:HEAT repeat protein
MYRLASVAVIVPLLAVGCASSRQDVAPPVPERVEMPRDEALIEEARQVIDQALASADAQRRANAVEAAEALPAAEAKSIIAPRLEDDDAIVRFAAAMAVGRERLDSPEIRQSLDKMVRGTSPNGRVAAIFALHRLGDTTHSQSLADATKAADPLLRSNAALALGLTGEPSAVAVLEPMLRDNDPNVRLSAAEALWRLGDPQGRRPLMAASLSGYTDEAVIATLGLGVRRDMESNTMLRSKLTDDYEEVALAAARSLGRLGDDAGYGVALRAVETGTPLQQGMAAAALGDVGRSDAQPILANLLRDSTNDNVRLAAAAAVLELDRRM